MNNYELKQFSDEDIDECLKNPKVQKLSIDFKKSDESDDDIMVSRMWEKCSLPCTSRIKMT